MTYQAGVQCAPWCCLSCCPSWGVQGQRYVLHVSERKKPKYAVHGHIPATVLCTSHLQQSYWTEDKKSIHTRRNKANPWRCPHLSGTYAMQHIKVTDKIIFATRNCVSWMQLYGNYCSHASESIVFIWFSSINSEKTEAIVSVRFTENGPP